MWLMHGVTDYMVLSMSVATDVEYDTIELYKALL
jgi:hypothetical protein